MSKPVRFAPVILALLVPAWLYGLALCIGLPEEPPGGKRRLRDFQQFEQFASSLKEPETFDFYSTGPSGTYWRARFSLAPSRLDVRWSEREALAALKAPQAQLIGCFRDGSERQAFWLRARATLRSNRLQHQKLGQRCLLVLSQPKSQSRNL